MANFKKKYDWQEIQKTYDAGLSLRDLVKKYQCSMAALAKAVKRGDLQTRDKKVAVQLRVKLHGPSTPTCLPETREKISKARIKYLEENPDKVPYIINHSSRESYPEKIFRTALTTAGITGWEQHYRHGIYAYDFAFIENKIDVEIDGATHNLTKVKQIDERRDVWSRSQGWTVVRFSATDVKTDVLQCIMTIQKLLE
jgi:very-short-patch-repair endonuclease